MLEHKIYLRLIIAVTAAAVLAGCSNNAPGTSTPGTTAPTSNSGANGSALTKVTIGYTPTIVLPQPLLGVENGEYARAINGVTFTGKQYDAGSGVVEGLRAGVIDIGAAGPYPALKAYAKDKDIVLLCNSATGGTELIVAKNSPYKTVKDLKGKVIGVNQLGSTVDAMVRYNLIKAGLNPEKDVRIIEVKPSEQADVLKSNQVAAVAAPAPWPSQAIIKANGRALLDWKQILDNGNYSSGSLFTTKKFADAHPDFIQKFVAANRAITDRLNKNLAQGDAEVLAAWSKVTTKTMQPAVAKAAFASIKFTTEIDEKELQSFADIANQVGALKQKADLSGFVYQSGQGKK